MYKSLLFIILCFIPFIGYPQKTITPLAYKYKAIKALEPTKPQKSNVLRDTAENSIFADVLSYNNRKISVTLNDSIKNKTTLTNNRLHFNPLQKRNLEVSSKFGSRIHPLTFKHHFHNGVDIKCYYAPLYAVISGQVTVGEDKRSGKYIVIDNPTTNIRVSYAHLSRVLVENGQFIEAGKGIGISGNSGGSTGPHLHFTLRINGKFVNPFPYIIH